MKEAMEKAEAKKLQPFYLRRFVVESRAATVAS